jgi:membrane fusion protein, multidrug efflux system
MILDRIDDALMLPTIAVVPELNTQKIFYLKNGKVEEARVQTGIRTSEKIQVLDGIARGDTVLTTGLLQARPGMEVNITDLKKSTDI